MTNTDKAILLGYDVHRNVLDSLGRMWKWCVSPSGGSGSIGYFNNKDLFSKWIADVNDIRRMQSYGITIIDFMEANK